MRISDWSSDVCSSDLYAHRCHELFLDVQRHFGEESENRRVAVNRALQVDDHGSKLMCGNGRPIRGVHRRQHLSYSVCHHSTHNTILFGSLFSYSRERLSKQESRSEEHTSELQSLMRISYAVFCLKKKTNTQQTM